MYLSLIDKFKSKKILVIGDLIIDGYVSGHCTRIAPEAPVPVVDVNDKKYCLGGAANVAANLKALGCQTMFCSVTGCDDGRTLALNLLQDAGINSLYLLEDPERRTLLKTRISTDGQCLVRIDEGTHSLLSEGTQARLIKKIKEGYAMCDAVLIADYDKGVVGENIIATLEELVAKNRKFIAVDSKKLKAYRNLEPDLVKPNYKEFIELTNGLPNHDNRIHQVKNAGEILYRECRARICAVTLDKEGVVVFNGSNFENYTPAPEIKNPQVSGAGDSFIAAFVLALVSNGSISDAAMIATETAKIAAEKNETSFCSKSELKVSFTKETKSILKSSSLKEICIYYRSQGKRIVFTNGCFDILHRGHIEYLNQAKKLGDVLIVGINTDASIKRLKGPERPINSLLDRIEVLSALSCVDHVFSFGSIADDTPINVIKLVKPAIFVKGGDYKDKVIPELKVLKECGAEIHFLPFVQNLSTSNIINKITNNHLKIVKTG